MKTTGFMIRTIALMGCVFSATSNSAEQAGTHVQLRTDVSVPYCAFDRSRAESKRISAHTALGGFSIQCQQGAREFRLTTPLSPFAKITRADKSEYSVKWYVRQGAPACDGDFVYPESVSLHSGNRAIDLTDNKSKEMWNYCVRLVPTEKDTLTMNEPWPLQGELSLILVDAKKGFILPSDASRIHVRFKNNSSHMTKEMQSVVDNLLINLGDPTQYHVQLHAHSSMLGKEAYNHDLSIMRLKRIREYLVDKYKIAKEDTWGQAWGESRPMALNTIEDEATQNRRVDIILIPKKESALKR